MQEVKWLSEEALQIAEKRRDTKNKGDTERYLHLHGQEHTTGRKTLFNK